MTALPKKIYTEAEYLALEETAPYKSEFYDGEIYPMGDFDGDTPEAMAGAKPTHNAIRENLSISIGSFLRKTKTCRTFSSDQRVTIPATGLYTYPDLAVVCGKPSFENDSLQNPVLIVEVLSQSTRSYDRSEKFEFYRSISTLKEYLLVDSLRIYVELHRKNDDGTWSLVAECRSLEDTISLHSIGLDLTLDDIYSNTEDLPNAIFKIR